MRNRAAHTNAVFEICVSDIGIGEPQVIDAFSNTGRPQSRKELEDVGEYIALNVTGILDSTIEDFVENNLITQAIENIYPVDHRFTPITWDEMDKLFANGIDEGWTKFRQQYPNSSGTLGLSDLGFDDNYTQAILCVEQQWGGLAGHGAYYIFQRQKSEWSVLERLIAWMS